MAMTDLQIVGRSMGARMFSTITTIITVAVAVALMLVLLSMRDSGRQAFSRGSGNMHLLVSRDDSAMVGVLNGIFYANPPRRSMEWSKFVEIRGRLPLEYAVPTQQGDSYRGFPVMGTTTDFFTKFKPERDAAWQFAEGRAFERSFEVVFGATAARNAGVRIGDTINLTHGIDLSRERQRSLDDAEMASPHVHHEYDYTVVGILAPTGGPHDRALFTDLESSWVIHAHDIRKKRDPKITTTVDDLVDTDKLITGIYIRVAGPPGSDAPPVLPQVFDELRRDRSIVVASPSQEISNLFRIVSNIDQIILALAGVVLLSSGIAIMLALYNSMEQRRRQIAVLRVLGASRGKIFSLIVTESAIIGLLGAAVGVAICFAGMYLVAEVMRRELGIVVSPSLSPEWVLLIVVGTVLLAAAAGIVPAVMAYRTSVSRNLRPLG